MFANKNYELEMSNNSIQSMMPEWVTFVSGETLCVRYMCTHARWLQRRLTNVERAAGLLSEYKGRYEAIKTFEQAINLARDIIMLLLSSDDNYHVIVNVVMNGDFTGIDSNILYVYYSMLHKISKNTEQPLTILIHSKIQGSEQINWHVLRSRLPTETNSAWFKRIADHIDDVVGLKLVYTGTFNPLGTTLSYGDVCYIVANILDHNKPCTDLLLKRGIWRFA